MATKSSPSPQSGHRQLSPEPDFTLIATASLARADGLITQWLPTGHRQGNEWVALNPTRTDAHPGSFKINLITGAWADFATGDQGGDLISLYAYLKHLSQGKAARELAHQLGLNNATRQLPSQTLKAQKTNWLPITPVPDDAPAPPIAHYRHGKPTGQWVYRNPDGRLLCYVYRFDRDGKHFAPLSFCQNSSSLRAWRWQALATPRPLYNLHQLATRPAAPVVICEGEKAADAAAALFPDCVATTSSNGSQSPNQTDWTPLRGRQVWIWADHDEAGRKYAVMAARLARAAGATGVYKLRLDADGFGQQPTTVSGKPALIARTAPLPTGWDAADALAEGWSVGHIELLRQNSAFWIEPPAKPSQPSSETALPPTGQFNLTEMGNAERLAHQHGANVRYCWEWGCWLVWDGARWQIDAGARIGRLAKQTVRSIYAEAATAADNDTAKLVARHGIRSESARAQRAFLELAQSEDGIPIQPGALDNNPWLLNCPNGTLDLQRGQLRQHRQDDYLTKRIDVAYEPHAFCPLWLRFLEQIFAGNAALIAFIQRAIGYSLTGSTREQCFFILHGAGANGKSTLLDVIQSLLGLDYAKQAAPELLLAKQHLQHPTELADLRGARLVSSVETGEGRRLAENLVKQMTGGDRIKARRMRENFWEYLPEFKLWLATNHKPEIRGTDYAIWRRIRLIPFNVIIPEGQRDPDFPGRLKTELPGILAWAVQGCLDWQQYGLQPPDEVRSATNRYQAEMDVLAAFLADCCVLKGNAKVKANDLYNTYRQWCEQGGERVETQTRFGLRLAERGFEKFRSATGWHYKGVGLQAIDPEAGEP